MLKRLLSWWKVRNCEHFWRPALYTRWPSNICGGRKDYGARVCDYCGKWDEMSDEEFYARFGRLPVL